MVFKVPAARELTDDDKFFFELPGDDTSYSVPKLKYLKPEIALTLEAGSEAEAMMILFREYMPEVLKRLKDGEQLSALFKAWQEASSISLGESSPSTGS